MAAGFADQKKLKFWMITGLHRLNGRVMFSLCLWNLFHMVLYHC